MPKSDDEVIDAKLEELDRLMEDLQKRRQELQATKEKAETPTKTQTFHKASELPKFTESNVELEETLDSLGWKSFKKKEGEWTFLRDRDGRLRDELDPVKEFIDQLRKRKDTVVGKYRYAVSEDRFLNRFFVAGT